MKADELKPRTIKIELTDKDAFDFFEKCYFDGTTPKEVIEGFVNDLIYGDHSHGSDEQDFANVYYDRVGYHYLNDNPTFSQWLMRHSCFYDAINLIEDITICESEIDYCSNDPEELEDPDNAKHIETFRHELEKSKQELNDLYKDYTEHVDKPESFEAGIDGIGKYTELEKLIKKGEWPDDYT